MDTNALVDIFELWEACNAAEVKLDDVGTWGELKAALEQKDELASRISREETGRLPSSIGFFKNLKDNSGTHLYYSSIVCRSEMHHVLLESTAFEHLVIHHIPHRLRIKRPQVLFRRALQASDYRNIQDNLNDFFDGLKIDYGIDIVDVERTSSTTSITFESIMRNAQELWSRILIEVMDSYIYAAAIEIKSDAFITSDGPLFDTLDNLNNPNSEWVSISESLKGALAIPEGASLPRPMKPLQNALPA